MDIAFEPPGFSDVNRIVNPGPAEPRYALPLQTV